MIDHTHGAPTAPPAAARAEGDAVLVFADGSRFRGRAYGAIGIAIGDARFETKMSGFQEALSAPESAGALITFTLPHVGITGVNAEDTNGAGITAAGVIVRDAARRISNFRAERSLDEALVDAGTVGITGVDTRAVTRKLRGTSGLTAGIFSGAAALELTEEEQLARVTGTQDAANGENR